MTSKICLVNVAKSLILAETVMRMEQEGYEIIGEAPEITLKDLAQRRRQLTCNLPEEEIVERDRPKSRQERRQMDRLRRKGRA